MVAPLPMPNPTPQAGGPRTVFTLWDPEGRYCVSSEGKPVSGHAAPVFQTLAAAQAAADRLNG